MCSSFEFHSGGLSLHPITDLQLMFVKGFSCPAMTLFYLPHPQFFPNFEHTKVMQILQKARNSNMLALNKFILLVPRSLAE